MLNLVFELQFAALLLQSVNLETKLTKLWIIIYRIFELI